MTGTVEPRSDSLEPRSDTLEPGTDTFEPVSGLVNREIALVDLLDRLLAGGVVLVGDLTVSLAGVDLIRISLRALITSITPVEPEPEEPS